jgi:WD40 repeat protein
LHQSIASEFVSASTDGTAQVWDIASAKVKYTLEGHQGIACVLSLQNGIVITGADKIRLWFRGNMEKDIKCDD